MAQPPEGRLLLALAGWSPPDAIHVAWCSQRCAACHRAAGTAARAASAGPPSSCAMAAQDRRAQIQGPNPSLKRRRSARVPSCPSAPPCICKIISARSLQTKIQTEAAGQNHAQAAASRSTPHIYVHLYLHTRNRIWRTNRILSRAPRRGAITTTRPKAKSAESTRPNHGELLASRARPLPLLSCTAIVPGTSLPGGDGSRIRPPRAACPMRSPLTPRPGPHTLGLVI